MQDWSKCEYSLNGVLKILVYLHLFKSAFEFVCNADQDVWFQYLLWHVCEVQVQTSQNSKNTLMNVQFCLFQFATVFVL